MNRLRLSGCLLILGMVSCMPLVEWSMDAVRSEPVKHSSQWSSRLVVVEGQSWAPGPSISSGLDGVPDGVEAGSATPVTEDGYFLTAAHVISGKPDAVIYLRYPARGVWRRARLVWVDYEDDLALLHAPFQTAGHYYWAPVSRGLPPGTPITHHGAMIEQKQNSGRTLSQLRPDSAFVGLRIFSSRVQLEPGDSGGAVVDSQGRLLGINSAVRFRMPEMIFHDTEVIRPNLRRLGQFIDADRRR